MRDRVVGDQRVVDPVRGGDRPDAEGHLRVGFTHYDDPPPGRDRRSRGAARRGRASASPTTSRPGSRSRAGGSSTAGTRAAGSWARRRCASRSSAPRSSRSRSPTSATSPRSHDDAVRFVQTTGGRTGLPAPRRVKHPPFVQFRAPDRVDHARAHDPRRRHVVVRGARREQVPAALGLRRRRQARRQGRPRRLQGVVPRRVREAHAVGRPRLEGARDRGRDRARAAALDHDHARGDEARDPHGQEGQARSSSRARTATTSSSCSTACCRW